MRRRVVLAQVSLAVGEPLQALGAGFVAEPREGSLPHQPADIRVRQRPGSGHALVARMPSMTMPRKPSTPGRNRFDRRTD